MMNTWQNENADDDHLQAADESNDDFAGKSKEDLVEMYMEERQRISNLRATVRNLQHKLGQQEDQLQSVMGMMVQLQDRLNSLEGENGTGPVVAATDLVTRTESQSTSIGMGSNTASKQSEKTQQSGESGNPRRKKKQASVAEPPLAPKPAPRDCSTPTLGDTSGTKKKHVSFSHQNVSIHF